VEEYDFLRYKNESYFILKAINIWLIIGSLGLIRNILSCSSDLVKDITKIMKNFDVYNKILSNKKIGRKDVIFEINETRIGKNKHRRGHVIKGFWEVGMV
jgi:hypothetical protein